jgi:molybdopterin-guanine dinucleotide biosynthesis protein A
MDTSKTKREHRMKYHMPAVIFAGGKSSRMGEDKALLPFGGFSTLAQYQYEKFKRYFEKVYISTKENKFNFNAELIHDKYEVHSPLAGIVSIFDALQEDEIFILSVDAPFVEKKEIGVLMNENREGYDAVIAQTQSGLQPLCGIYKRSLIPLAEQELKENRHRLTHLLQQSRSKFVIFEEEEPFTNLNHPYEYREALERTK